MSKTEKPDDEMLAEYDFSQSIPNPYTRGRRMSEAVFLDPDVRAAFPTSKQVNEALRSLLRSGKKKPA